MANNNQNKAEQYRQERKERLAKAAKKNAKNVEKKVTTRSLIKKVVAIVVVAALALGCVAGILSYSGVLQRLAPVGYVADEGISYAEYLYYYSRAYNTLSQTAQYYQYYGYDYGYDTSLAPQDQTKTTTDEDGNEISWVEYLHAQAVDMSQMYLTFYQEAKKAKIELSKAELASIDDQIEELRESAAEANKKEGDEESEIAGYSLNAYLRKVYGNGITESFLRKQLKIETLAQRFYEVKTQEFETGYSEEQVKKVFDEDPDSYQFVDLRLYSFQSEELTKGEDETEDELKARQEKADKETKENANAMYAEIKDEASFVAQASKYNKTENYDAQAATKLSSALKTQSQLNQQITALDSVNEDLSKWAFDGATKANDKKLIEDSENGVFYVALMVNPKHSIKTVSVRHILFTTKDSESGEALSDEDIKKAKENASKTLAEWKAGDATEDSFATYANDLSDDNGGEVTNGGLYEYVVPGQTVTAFNDWIFDGARKEGDTEIVETDYGYHIIYFISKNADFYDSAIRSTLATDDLNTLSEELLASDEYVIGVGPRRVAYIEDKLLKKYAKNISMSASNAS